MTETVKPLDGTWNLPADEERRQAIAPLRGYAYQLHQSVAAWLNLPEGATLYLEVAEDYATIAADPQRLKEILTTIQVKDTRESGAVTLNSQDIRDAIAHFWNLQEANPGRKVRLIFLTTSSIGPERKNRLENGVHGLEAWRQAAEGADVAELRKALTFVTTGKLAHFVREARDDELLERLIRRITLTCGESQGKEVESRNRAALVEMRHLVQSTADLAERAYDALLVHVLNTIVRSESRTLTRDGFIEQFRKATSISIPSQVVVDNAIGNAPGAKTLTKQALLGIAKSLLASGSPPSLLPLFPGASKSAHEALDDLGRMRRLVTDDRATVELFELNTSKDLHHLIVAPPGSGKSHALWHVANQMLQSGNLIPLYIPSGELESWSDIIELFRDFRETTDALTLFSDPRICVIFDGWSEFAHGRGANERAKVRRAINRTRVIASARHGGDASIFFHVWNLEPLPISTVRRTIKTAHPSIPFPDPSFLEFLRLPLALSLFVLLDAAVLTRGELIEHLHERLSRDIPEGFLSVLAGAVAAVRLSGTRSYSQLQNELGDRAKRASISEPSKLLASLGTLENRAGIVRPVHDLYWSWLSGLGLLCENKIGYVVTNISTREDFQLALESGARSSKEMVDAVCSIDVLFASLLSTGAGTRKKEENVLLRTLDEMFADDRLPMRCRAALAGLRSKNATLLLPSLKVMSQVFGSGLYIQAFESALEPKDLFPNRGIIAEWIGAQATDVLINSIATRGGAEWAHWLEELAHSGKLDASVVAAAAIACEGRVPNWAVEHLPSLLKTKTWNTSSAANRAGNVELARWIAEHYEEYVEVGNSRWIHLNRVLVSCGDDAVFEQLLARFPSLTKAAQETLGFAVVQLGDPWLARFQKVAFRTSGATQHHQLAEALSLDIDDATARSWIGNGYFEPGWRVLVARHGDNIVPEMLANLPESFDGVDDIPILAAMRFLNNPPESLIDEIWGRIGGTLWPKVMQDAINVLARIRPAGIPSIVKRVAANPGLLPSYHLSQFLLLLKGWEDETGLRVNVRTGLGVISFAEWIILSRFPKDKDDVLFRRALSGYSELTIRLILNEFRANHKAVRELLEQIEPLIGYDATLFDFLLTAPDLFDLIPKIFSQAFDTFPEEALLRAVEASGDKFGELLRGLVMSSTPTHWRLHREIVRKVLDGKLDMFVFRQTGRLLRVHPREHLLELLRSVMLKMTATEIWLVREIEAERQELLIDENAGWLP